MQPRDLGGGKEGARRVVWIGDEDQARGRRHGGDQAVHVGAVVTVLHLHRGRFRPPNRDWID